ncbi:MAG TPA: transglycosylase SLT domain-containing protein [Candidatus Competibacteraceae bacterium]|nr:transglycosylase SLT domain-containing protein [Candidatus Competibacteraceae bacterium]
MIAIQPRTAALAGPPARADSACLVGMLVFLLCCSDVRAASAGHDAQEPDWQTLLRKRGPQEQTEWGLRYEHGEGVSQDYGRAIQLYCAAARRGYVLAQYQLGWIYANGRGVERDEALAAAWFQLAAAQGDDQSQRMLAVLGPAPRGIRPACRQPVRTPEVYLADQEPSPQRRQVEGWVQQLAPRYGLDPELVLAIIQVESAFDSNARSHKNAQGLMQLIPETADRFGVRDPYDPVQNLHGGMAYMSWLLDLFQCDLRLALAAYNAGEKAVQRYAGIPPYAETQQYVTRITRLYGRTKVAYGKREQTCVALTSAAQALH